MGDVLNIEILEDGTIKTTTDKITPANHSSAEQFFSLLKRLCGGSQSVKPRLGHVHTHGNVTHSH